MASLDEQSLLDKVERSGRIDADDVLALRRVHYGDGLIDAAEADFIFDLEDRVRTVVPDWSDFFVEAITDHLVHQAEPEGHVDDARAGWLIGRITADGRVRSETELELLVRVVERARAVPFRLAALALAEVRRAVVEGRGLTRHGALDPGRITMAEVVLVRRVLHGTGGDSGIAVSREEAEALFAIDEAIGGAGEPGALDAWARLFARAIGNYVTAAVLHPVPDRAEALRRQLWLDAPEDGPGFLDRLIDGLAGFGDLIEGLTQSLGERVEQAHAEENRRRAARLEEAAPLDPGEVDWLVARIGRDRRLSVAEQALVDFLGAGAAGLPAALEALVARLDRAA